MKVYAEMGESMSLRLEGHATGRPEVCAAASCLACTLAGYAANREREGGALVEEMEMETGRAVLRLRGDERTRGAFEAAVLGFLQLEREYPQCIQTETRKK